MLETESLLGRHASSKYSSGTSPLITVLCLAVGFIIGQLSDDIFNLKSSQEEYVGDYYAKPVNNSGKDMRFAPSRFQDTANANKKSESEIALQVDPDFKPMLSKRFAHFGPPVPETKVSWKGDHIPTDATVAPTANVKTDDSVKIDPLETQSPDTWKHDHKKEEPFGTTTSRIPTTEFGIPLPVDHYTKNKKKEPEEVQVEDKAPTKPDTDPPGSYPCSGHPPERPCTARPSVSNSAKAPDSAGEVKAPASVVKEHTKEKKPLETQVHAKGPKKLDTDPPGDWPCTGHPPERPCKKQPIPNAKKKTEDPHDKASKPGPFIPAGKRFSGHFGPPPKEHDEHALKESAKNSFEINDSSEAKQLNTDNVEKLDEAQTNTKLEFDSSDHVVGSKEKASGFDHNVPQPAPQPDAGGPWPGIVDCYGQYCSNKAKLSKELVSLESVEEESAEVKAARAYLDKHLGNDSDEEWDEPASELGKEVAASDGDVASTSAAGDDSLINPDEPGGSSAIPKQSALIPPNPPTVPQAEATGPDVSSQSLPAIPAATQAPATQISPTVQKRTESQTPSSASTHSDDIDHCMTIRQCCESTESSSMCDSYWTKHSVKAKNNNPAGAAPSIHTQFCDVHVPFNLRSSSDYFLWAMNSATSASAGAKVMSAFSPKVGAILKKVFESIKNIFSPNVVSAVGDFVKNLEKTTLWQTLNSVPVHITGTSKPQDLSQFLLNVNMLQKLESPFPWSCRVAFSFRLAFLPKFLAPKSGWSPLSLAKQEYGPDGKSVSQTMSGMIDSFIKYLQAVMRILGAVLPDPEQFKTSLQYFVGILTHLKEDDNFVQGILSVSEKDVALLGTLVGSSLKAHLSPLIDSLFQTPVLALLNKCFETAGKESTKKHHFTEKLLMPFHSHHNLELHIQQLHPQKASPAAAPLHQHPQDENVNTQHSSPERHQEAEVLEMDSQDFETWPKKTSSKKSSKKHNSRHSKRTHSKSKAESHKIHKHVRADAESEVGRPDIEYRAAVDYAHARNSLYGDNWESPRLNTLAAKTHHFFTEHGTEHIDADASTFYDEQKHHLERMP